MQKFKTSLILFTIIFPVILWAAPFADSYQLGTAPSTGLAGNGITDIAAGTRMMWFGTGYGLSRSQDNGVSFESFSVKHGLGDGSVSALWVHGDTILVATANDTLTNASESYLSNGTGLSISTNNGVSWKHIRQTPLDYTSVQNLSYDIAVLNGTIWLANFGGGLVRGDNFGETWVVNPPDSFLFDPGKELNHRVFSVIAVDDELWVGTAEGINKSTDGGKSWKNFKHTSQEQPISGNFVNGLACQKTGGRKIIWASTWKAEDEDEYYGVSKSENGGLTWSVVLGTPEHQIKAANFSFDGATVYVATYDGLYKSTDFGDTWYLFPPVVDPDVDEKIYGAEAYSVYAQNNVIWLGTSDGLARTTNNGYTWDIMRAFKPTGQGGVPRTYAYPNPFSPTRDNLVGNDGFVRLQYNTLRPTRVTIKVYDFAMDLVTTVVEGKIRYTAGNFNEVWNGRNDYGDPVANGVYFYCVSIEEDGAFWGKILIVN